MAATYENSEKIEKYLRKQAKWRDRGDSRAVYVATAQNYLRFIDDYLRHEDHGQVEEWAGKERTALVAQSVEEWLEETEASDEWLPTTKGVAAFAVANYYKTMFLFHVNHKVLPFAQNVQDAEFDPDILTMEEVETAFDHAQTVGKPRLLDAMVIGWNCICRVSEIVELERDDVDLDEPYVTIRGKKSSNDYTFTPDDPPVNDETPTPYGLWTALENRVDDANGRGADYLFASGSDHLAPNTMSTWYRRNIGKWGPFGRPLSIHAFARHTRITHLRSEGHPIDDIQTWARHKNRQSTQVYNRQDILNRL